MFIFVAMCEKYYYCSHLIFFFLGVISWELYWIQLESMIHNIEAIARIQT